MQNFREIIITVALLLFLPDVTRSQAPQPDGAGIRPGALPKSWLLGGPKCVEIPEFQVHEYNEDFYILRQSGCSNYEKPFLYLLFGRDRALLLDTGAGKTDIARVVSNIVEKWLARSKHKSIELVVAHTRSHDDHTGGDNQFKVLPNTTLVLPNLNAVQSFFGIRNWPEEIGHYDLGDRIVDVIAIPGHQAAS